MAMSLAALEILEEAQFPPAQARAITRVLEADSASRLENLVTKADLKADLAEFRQAVTADMARLEVKIESAKMEGMRWTFMMMIGQVTLLTGIMYFLLQNLR